MSLGTPIPNDKTCISCVSFRKCKEKFGANWLSPNCAYSPTKYELDVPVEKERSEEYYRKRHEKELDHEHS